jgi:hypothetical protein
MGSPCRCAAAITVRSIARATKPHGGQMLALIRLSLPVRFGWRPIPCRQVPTTSKSRARRPLSALIRRTSSVVGRSPDQARIALGRKLGTSSRPLCRGDRREVHRCGDEKAWWKMLGIDPAVSARVLWLEKSYTTDSEYITDRRDAANSQHADVGDDAEAQPFPISTWSAFYSFTGSINETARVRSLP